MNKKILIFLFLSQHVVLQLKQYTDCDNIEFEQFQQSTQEIDQWRRNTQSHYKGDYNKVLHYFWNNDSNAMINLIAPFAAFLIIFLCIGFFSLIFFILQTCNGFKKGGNHFWHKTHLRISWLCIALILIFFIPFCVYIGKSNKKFQKAKCGIVQLGQHMVYGEKKGYMGVSNYENTYQFFYQEYNQLIGKAEIMREIYKEQLPETAQRAQESLVYFYYKFRDNTTNNMYGAQSRPISVIQLDDGINDRIESEFQQLSQTASAVHLMAHGGLTLNNNPSYKSDVQNYANKFNTVNNKISIFMDHLTDYNIKAFDFFQGGYISVLIFILINMIIIFLFVFIFKKQQQNKKYIQNTKYQQFMNIIGVLLVMAGMISLFFPVISYASISNTCSVIGYLNQGDWKILESLDYQFDQEVEYFVKSCLDPNEPRNYNEFHITFDAGEVSIIQSVADILNGIAQYNQFMKYTDNLEMSKTIQFYRQELTNILNMQTHDHKDIKEKISILNKSLECNKEQIQLNQVGCLQNSSMQCTPLLENENYSLPSCADSQQSQDILNNLKGYILQQKTLMSNMLDSLDKDNESPELLYEQANRLLQKFKEQIRVIQGTIPIALSTFDYTNQTFDEASDCKVLQNHLLKTEITVCFEYNMNLYYLSVFAFLCLIFEFFAFWFIFMAVIRKEQDMDISNVVSDNDFDKYNETGQFEDNIETINFSPYEIEDKKMNFQVIIDYLDLLNWFLIGSN